MQWTVLRFQVCLVGLETDGREKFSGITCKQHVRESYLIYLSNIVTLALHGGNLSFTNN